METKGMSLDEFIQRKLQPVKILVANLNREMELDEGDEISMTRMEFDNLITTLEIFIEEYERVSNVRGKRMQKRGQSQFVQAQPTAPQKPAIKAIG